VAASSPRSSASYRLYLLGGILFLWCCVICLRLVYLQVFCYGDFEQRAQHQQQRTFEVSAKRGIIYDRSGHELAMSIQVDSAFAVPSEIPDLPTALSLVSRITKEDPRVVLADCRARKSFCWVARKADPETIDRIRSLNLQGIHFQKESKRFYPKRELAAQVLGYVGTDDEGLSGVEREYDENLRGKPGRMMISVDARKKWFSRIEKDPDPGDNVVLTIDENIQYIAERELQRAMKETHAETGTAIVQNPHTGEILALANYPTFNPNLSKEITPARLKNHAVSDIYEPGSTFKVVTLSAALDEKLTRPDEVFDCQMGSIVINGRRIHDWKPFGSLTVADILAHSSDVGAIKVALRLGDERLYKYIRAYGFGQQTGIELPGETRGLAKPLSRWSKVSIGAISMGQEIGISPLQLIGMISTIANDGVRVAPRIVAATVEPRGVPQQVAFHSVVQQRAIAPLTAAQMKQMMEGVVLHGTGKKAILEGFSAAGKSGTAQKVDPATGTYSRTKYIASFAGFAPVNDPAVTIAVILDSPIGGHHGGEVAGPVFGRIGQAVLEYLHVAHDVELPANHQQWLAQHRAKDKDKDEDIADASPDRLGDPLEVADLAAPDAAAAPLPTLPATPSVKPSPVGAAVVQAGLREKEVVPAPPPPPPASLFSADHQTKDQQAKLPSTGTVVLDVEQGGIEVPSFLGKSVRAAIEAAEDAGLEVDAVGDGIARDQSPAAGAHVPAGAHVTVKFER